MHYLIELGLPIYGEGGMHGRTSKKSLHIKPVPQTDTGIREEYSQARELNLPKELGKLALYLR